MISMLTNANTDVLVVWEYRTDVLLNRFRVDRSAVIIHHVDLRRRAAAATQNNAHGYHIQLIRVSIRSRL